tara:strand:+ start:160396 stop:160884 length:489 start_codon:yes stop_codon:yes gene_type:complete
MKRITFLFAVLLALSGCRQFETITMKTTTTVDSVAVDVPLPGHDFADIFELDALLSDSLIFEDARVRIRIVPDTSGSLPRDARSTGEVVPLDSAPVPPARFRIEAEVKPDTARIKVAEKTTTIATEHTKYKKQMPWWGWVLLGGLTMVSLILLVLLQLAKWE